MLNSPSPPIYPEAPVLHFVAVSMRSAVEGVGGKRWNEDDLQEDFRRHFDDTTTPTAIVDSTVIHSID